ncbi:MAG: phosphoenolpyruvate--protein phosphotransferase [Eubacteriales bacterium]
MEQIFKGINASPGIAMGETFFIQRDNLIVTNEEIQDVAKEIEIFKAAQAKADKELEGLHQKALTELGPAEAEILEAHRMMLADLDFVESIENIIKDEMLNAACAVERTKFFLAKMFTDSGDDYMMARADDVRDISNRVIKHLLGGSNEGLSGMEKPVIVIAEDLYPSDTISMDKSKVLALVTERGSQNSHTAILARTLGIPAVVGAKQFLPIMEKNTLTLIIDGSTGEMILDPSPETVAKYQEKQKEEQARKERLLQYKDRPAQTMDGVTIEVCANIGDVPSAKVAFAAGADGIGLFRSEFIYLDQDDFPTEDYQFGIYKEVLETMEGKRVIVRTLDLGADKQAPYFQIPNEENPAMGYRALRICLAERHIFITQLRALFRASVYGKLAIMFPMVISVSEVLEIRACLDQVMAELDAEKIPYASNIEIGIMIETPAAAVLSDLLAQHVDFFSIGTNDLTQYTLAVDRMNEKIEDLYSYHHEAVLRLMEMTVKNAHAHGTWVGICGESGGDTTLTERYIAMGIDELSCSPSRILEVKEKIILSGKS